MWIVRLALRRPYTFVVMSLLIAVLGGLAIFTMSTDIFPEINIPVVSVIWSYGGISPYDMEKRIITISERAMTTTVNGIEHMESQSLNGVGVIKIYFQPNVHIEEAVAEVTSIQQTILRVLPTGVTPPLIIRYSASSVPVLQIAVSSKTLSEQELYDYNLNFVRQQLATVQAPACPCHLAASRARLWSISTRRPCTKGSRRVTSPRAQPAKPHPPLGQRQNRRAGVSRKAQQQPGCGGRVQ